MRARKTAAVVVLLIIITAAVVFVVKRTGVGAGGPAKPAWMLEQQIEKVDILTGESVTRQHQEWERLGQSGGAYKNPKTGLYTMSDLAICIGCGAKVPVLSAPSGSQPPAPGAPGKWVPTEKCPKCGKAML